MGKSSDDWVRAITDRAQLAINKQYHLLKGNRMNISITVVFMDIIKLYYITLKNIIYFNIYYFK